MATKSLLSRDISSLRQELLDDIELDYQQPGPERNLDRDNQTAAATNQRSRSATPDSIPELPSTVPESQFQSNVETQLPLVPDAPKPAKQTATGKKMTSQASDGTQELSPSHYDEYLRSRSEQQLPEDDREQDMHQNWDGESDDEHETGVTQHEGDAGYVDLSFDSLKPRDGEDGATSQPRPIDEEVQVQEPEDSEPIEVDFSPTQPQNTLSPFPESQRFKTPATAGKKRSYDGGVVDSPELPRHPAPLLRGRDNNNSGMALSQVFNATQANTSPYIPKLNGALHSDRPSPNINLQVRPVTADSSSPMRPLPSIKRSRRAGSEPLDNYVSLEESQVRRERRHRQVEEEMARNIDFDDEELAIEEDSLDIKYRRERERDERIQPQLLSSSPRVSSPRGRFSLSRSSPVRGPRRSPIRNVRIGRRPRFSPQSSPSRIPYQSQVTESEEETEQEDNMNVAMTGSSQPAVSLDEEDKENFSEQASQVPETTGVRLQRIVNELPSQVQESPLIRNGRSLNRENQPRALRSSQPFAVADSQPERAAKRPRTFTQVPGSSAAHARLDFVPQSPESSPQPTDPVDRETTLVSLAVDEKRRAAEQPKENLTVTIEPASTGKICQALNSTIPETSSNEPQVLSGNASDGMPQNVETESRGEFETAQTHLQPSLTRAQQPVEVNFTASSPPLPTTPLVKKRKRIADIQAEPSPLKSQLSFDASAALRLDANFSDPEQGSLTLRRFTRSIANEAEMPAVDPANAPTQSASKTPQDGAARHNGINQDDVENKSGVRPATETQEKLTASPLSTRPQRERIPSAKVLRNAQSATMARMSRHSQYDLPESPPKKAVPVSKPSSTLKRKVEDIVGTSDKASGLLSKRQKLPEKKQSAPETLLETEKRQETPDPTISQQPVPVSGAAGSEDLGDIAEHADDEIVAPNMVFAIFRGSSPTYHPALCLGRPDAESNRFTIQWKGYAPDIVDESGVRSLDLRIGDQVKIEMEGFPRLSHVIRGFKDKIEPQNPLPSQTITDIRGYQTLLVAPKQRKGLPANVSLDVVRRVPVSAIYLDKNMWSKIKDRTYNYKPMLSSSISTPVVRSSTPSTPSSRSRRGTVASVPPPSSAIDVTGRVFQNMAFAISYEDSNRKDELADLVRENGGIVLAESFLDLFEPDSVQLKEQYADLVFTALLTDRHSRKEKYLQALALGFPCLGGRWIEASVQSGRIADWPSYLLAAGESTELEGATKSRILQLPSSMQGSRVADMIAARAKILANARVVVIVGKGKGKADGKRKLLLSLIRALGPNQIDTKSDLNSARTITQSAAESDEPVDYVFVDDRDIESARDLFFSAKATEVKDKPKGRKGPRTRKVRVSEQPKLGMNEESVDSATPKVKILCNEDIVQSLILGRLWIGA